MKKSLRKPSNWQDFEDLCKKLFGEIWQCPYTIKKNGRQGNEQFGVDVYARPNGETDYFGIQCKGKDEYAHKNLTRKEIDQEILKANCFKPQLRTFIFATTANKDASIEEYIRIKDIESRASGSFGILLYCWEDLVDFIEENRTLFNWYVNGFQFKETHKVKVGFSNGKDLISTNILYSKIITKYKIKDSFVKRNNSTSIFGDFVPIGNPFNQPSEINRSKCKVDIIIDNIGEKVIEDWKLNLYFNKGTFEDIYDDNIGYVWRINKDYSHFRTSWAFKEDGYILCKPLENKPLIQKDSKTFTVSILPRLSIDEIKIHWTLLARDYNDEGDIFLQFNSEYTEVINTIEVDNEDQIKEDLMSIEYLIENKKK